DADAVAVGGELVHERVERGGEGAALGVEVGGQQRELALGADDGARAGDGAAGALAQAGPAVGADAHDGDAHASVSRRASTSRALASGSRAVRRRWPSWRPGNEAAGRTAMRRSRSAATTAGPSGTSTRTKF